ncbi:MAG: 50S ribosomal protein L1 [Planctomycetota bacterium]
MKKHSKRYREAFAKVDREQTYPIDEGVKLLKQFKQAGFDETVEVDMNLGIDTKQSDQQVRGSISLPNGIGKSVRAIVFAEGDVAEQAVAAGAMEAGGDDLVEKVNGGWTDFDVVIAHRSMMPKVGRLGRVLGPRGLMPSPKTGTVTDDVVGVLKEYLAGKVEFRADEGGNLHAPVGKMSFEQQSLVENVRAFCNHIKGMKPPASKGIFMKNVVLSSTMGPGIKLSL